MDTLEKFNSVFNQIKIIDDFRQRFIEAKDLCRPDGLVLEFGVYNGGTITTIQDVFNTIVYGFDSWEGLPDEDPSVTVTPGFSTGAFKTNKPTGLNSNIIFVDGWFNDSIPVFLKELKEDLVIRFIHIDCDQYISTKHVFNHLGPFIKSGTFLEFDEFAFFENWEQREFRAFKELVEMYNLDYEYIHKSHDAQRVGIIIK